MDSRFYIKNNIVCMHTPTNLSPIHWGGGLPTLILIYFVIYLSLTDFEKLSLFILKFEQWKAIFSPKQKRSEKIFKKIGLELSL